MSKRGEEDRGEIHVGSTWQMDFSHLLLSFESPSQTHLHLPFSSSKLPSSPLLPLIPQVLYVGTLLGMSLHSLEHDKSGHKPHPLVAYFTMVHVMVWAIVGVFDR